MFKILSIIAVSIFLGNIAVRAAEPIIAPGTN